MTQAGLFQYLRTVRYLKPSQVLWRVRYMAEKRLGPVAASVPEWDSWDAACNWDAPLVPVFKRPGPTGAQALKNLSQGEFEHLSTRVRIGLENTDWRLGPQTFNRLWTGTLHYHYWAYDLAEIIRAENQDSKPAEGLFKRYLGDWLERCGLEAGGSRELAWNSFTIATRLGWLVRTVLLLGRERMQRWPDLTGRLIQSMWKQAAFLNNHIEWDLRGNHLMRDAAGLAWAARVFKGSEPKRWMQKAAQIALDQVEEQVLPDGGHFERSPMYHVHVMEDVLTLALLLDDAVASETMKQAWCKMADYLVWIRHPDGKLPLFNDGALEAVCEPDDMLGHGELVGAETAAGMPRGGKHFAGTGMIVWHGEPWTVFFDAGDAGPDCQPGHAHADNLSIECSFRGKRLFVDPGTHSYDNDDRRAYDRSTAAHNTVAVDGVNSSEVWHIFRVGRRARPVGVSAEFSAKGMRARASHDGYDRLSGRPRHERGVSVEERERLIICDKVTGSGVHKVQAGLLLAPGWKADVAPGGWSVSADDTRIRVNLEGPEGLKMYLEERPYHPQYGMELMTTRLCWDIDGPLPVELRVTVEAEK